MNSTTSGLPLFVKAVFVLLGLIALIAVLYYGQSILVPLVFALIISIVLHPLVKSLERFGIHKVLAIIFSILLTFLVIISIGVLLASQISRFSDSWPSLVERFTKLMNESVSWASGYFDIKPRKINEWVTQTKFDLTHFSSVEIGNTLITLGSGLVVTFLVPVYIFLFLFYQPLLIEFIHRLFHQSNQEKVSEVVKQIKNVIQRYLVGLVIEAALVAVMEITALLALGIEYALLLGIIGALLNVIPYIGGLVAVALPMMVALATKTSPWYALYVLAIYYLIQLIDNNYIVPKIVASKVKINALFSIVVVIAGNALWGVSGMFLSIPILAIIKLIFDHVEPLKPWGFLLGDSMPPILDIKKTPLGRKLLKTK